MFYYGAATKEIGFSNYQNYLTQKHSQQYRVVKFSWDDFQKYLRSALNQPTFIEVEIVTLVIILFLYCFSWLQENCNKAKM